MRATDVMIAGKVAFIAGWVGGWGRMDLIIAEWFRSGGCLRLAGLKHPRLYPSAYLRKSWRGVP
jgi:hypothetical protein